MSICNEATFSESRILRPPFKRKTIKIMMTKQIVKSMVGALAFAGVAQAGPAVSEAPVNSGDWCTSLKTIGKVYSSDTNPYIQEVKFFGRAHYQWAYVDGDAAAGNFSGNGDELRRLRFGTSVKFLNGFKLKTTINLVDDSNGFRRPELGFDSFYDLVLSYKLGDVAGFSDVSLAYGRMKHTISHEAHVSSKYIKTIERSNIANHFYKGLTPTGFKVNAKRGEYKFAFALFSTDGANDTRRKTWGAWNDGLAYYLNVQRGGWNLDFIYNDVNAGDQDSFGFEWATSLAYNTKVAGWDLMVNGILGNESNGADTFGLVVMPTKFIIEDKLEAVVRYQFAGSSEDRLRATKRYVRRVAAKDGVALARGNRNHTLYAGLNYYLCGNNAKFMTGIEYEKLDGAAENIDAVTFLTAFRMYF